MDSHHFREALRDGRTLVLDGGLATQLEAQGADLSDRLWSARTSQRRCADRCGSWLVTEVGQES